MNDEKKVESIVTNFVLVENFDDGSFREQGEGDQFTDEFWEGVPVSIYHHQHLRVQELKGQVRYQYRLVGGAVYLRTLSYYLTSRPSSSHWYRANIDIQLESFTSHRVNSPDTMSQNFQWHTYIVNASVNYSAQVGARLRVRVEYDGRNNGVGERDSWGNQEQLVFL